MVSNEMRNLRNEIPVVLKVVNLVNEVYIISRFQKIKCTSFNYNSTTKILLK
ncbi:MAG: hypothetical protein LBD03_06480 [Methanobrevibacter sp.]|nr:hypothetical protein [Candidatus Methanovirga procula]